MGDALDSRFCDVLSNAFEQASSDTESMVVKEVHIEPTIDRAAATF